MIHNANMMGHPVYMQLSHLQRMVVIVTIRDMSFDEIKASIDGLCNDAKRMNAVECRQHIKAYSD